MKKLISSVFAIVGNPGIARFLSEKFAGDKYYFAIMEEPWIKRPDAENEIIRRNNLSAFIRHEYLILAGCETKTCELFFNHLPKSYHKKIIIINNSQELDKYIDVLAKYFVTNDVNKQYISLSQLDNLSHGDKIAIIETSGSIGEVIAENFCIAEGYKILKIEKATSELTDDIEDLLRAWNLGEDDVVRENAREKLFGILKNRTGNLDELEFAQLVFFTKGIPYGILPFQSPVTHFLSERDLGLQILAGYKRINEEDNSFAVALICDPGDIPDTESAEIKKTLTAKGVEILDLTGNRADIYRFMHLIERYPFDFAWFSSHAGEVDGRRITSEIISSKGSTHKIIYDLYASFAPVPGEENVIVTEMIVPVSIDGIPWSNKARIREDDNARYFNLKEFIEEIKHNDQREKVLKTEDSQGIKFSNALKLYKLTWIPAMHVLGETRYPIVFNNACSSWIAMAGRFIFAGASVYIGTTKSIHTAMATKCGIDFITSCLYQLPMCKALFGAQKSFIKQLGYSPYLYWGHPDIFLQPPNISSRIIRKARIHDAIIGLRQKEALYKNDDMKKKINSIIKCILEAG